MKNFTFLLILPLICHQFTCDFNTLYPSPIVPSPSDKPDQLQPNYHFGRSLLALSRQSIRITLDTTDFNSIKSTSNGEAQTTRAKLNFIEKAMKVSKNFLQTRLKVSRVSLIYSPNTCVDFNPPANDISSGVSSSDLHIYLRYITDSSVAYSATGKSCKYINTLPIPDSTLQQGRPTVGRIIFNTFKTIDAQTTLSNKLFSQTTSLALHEMIHILGFDHSLYSTFLNPDDGNLYVSPTSQTILNSKRNAGGGNYILQTPFVTAWAKNFFGCSSLVGMALENEEGNSVAGSHWERLAMYDELMTETGFGGKRGFSGLTFALLKDMGWYQVDDTFNQTVKYGYQMGCSFYNDACYANPFDSRHFCSSSEYEDISTCSTNFLGKATCSSNASYMSDGCGLFSEYLACSDDSEDDGYKAYTQQTFSDTSFCLEGTLGNVEISSKYRSRCYPSQCFTDYLQITVGKQKIICKENEEGIQKTLSFTGYLQCPNFNDFCGQLIEVCPNYCSQNGICTRGICNCDAGFSGEDCSQTTCGSNEFYDDSTKKCKLSCLSGTYENQYSHACLPCSDNCLQCRDEPTICTSCKPADYSHNSTCLSQCPVGTYQNGGNCDECDASADCKSCSSTSTQCTSCLDGKFLSSGSCVSSCSGSTPFHDVINGECVQSCAGNLVHYASTPGQGLNGCDLCAAGFYKLKSTGTCESSCPSGYFASDQLRLCEDCDSSCVQCNGGSAYNCTQCNNASSSYLILGSCLGHCPRGYYVSESEGTCKDCPANLNCFQCIFVGNAVQCSMCKEGYYLQENKSCLNSCESKKFKNEWSRSCDDCQVSCKECTTPSSASCTSCVISKYFLTNSSGSFCLDSCPTQGYTMSGINCLECYANCLTCEGVTKEDCLTCNDAYYLSQGECLYVCPPSTFPHSEKKTCDNCNDSCIFCFGPTINNCTTCIDGLVLNNFTCTSTCPEGIEANDFGICFECWVMVYCLISLWLLLI